MIGNNESSHEQSDGFSPKAEQTNHQTIDTKVTLLRESEESVNICSTQSINIDPSNNGTQRTAPITRPAIDIANFVSSWQRNEISNRDDNSGEENEGHSNSSNTIQIVFSIPYTFSNASILNNTVFIIDATQNQLLATLTNVCVEGSSFTINYSTMKPLPQTICLYLLLNLASSSSLREILFCRTIDDLSKDSSSSFGSHTRKESNGPSALFILSQCIIILVMMLIISIVHTARKRSFVDRMSQRLVRSRPYIRIFGNRSATNASQASRTSIDTLRDGLARLALHQQLASLNIPPTTAPIEEQVLAANDLTSTLNDRRASRPMINRDLIDLKEFQKKMSVSH